MSGGLAKGAYEFGFCKALSSHPNFELSAISSASIGTLNGYSLACNKLRTAEQFWNNIDISGFKQVCNSYYKQGKIYDIIERLCLQDDILSFPLYTVCATSSLKPLYVRLDKLTHMQRIQYLRACISMVGFTNGITIENTRYYDGAILDNTPVIPILSKNLDLIIIVQFDDYIPNVKLTSSNCPIVVFSFQDDTSILRSSLCFEQDSISQMIEKGFRRSNNFLSQLESKFDDKLAFKDYICEINSYLVPGKTSGDKMVRAINRLSKLIR